MKFFALLQCMLLLTGCALSVAPVASTPSRQIIVGEVLWSGTVRVDGEVLVAKGATLSISPGTRVRFVRRDADQDGFGDATLVVEGRLLALGTAQQPIFFQSDEDSPQEGDWLQIRPQFSPEIHLRHTVVEHAAYGIHAHFSRLLVEDSVFRRNMDGFRMGRSQVEIRYSLVEDNLSKGINFRDSDVEIHHNLIRRNGSGIFLFEKPGKVSIHNNALLENRHSIRLGDFFRADIEARGNWYGTSDSELAVETLYDGRMDALIGSIRIAAALRPPEGVGPRNPSFLEGLGIGIANP